MIDELFLFILLEWWDQGCDSNGNAIDFSFYVSYNNGNTNDLQRSICEAFLNNLLRSVYDL